MPLELDELLDELDELEDELLELEEVELLELEELFELDALEELEELEELELLLEALLPPPQPTNQILVATSASDKTRLFVVKLFMMLITLLFIDVLSGDCPWGDFSQIGEFDN